MIYVVPNSFLSFFRIFYYALFFWRVRRNHFTNYYYVWLPAIAAWIHDGICLYYYIVADKEDFKHDEKILLNHASVQITLYLKAVLILFGVWKYQTKIIKHDTTVTKSEQQPIDKISIIRILFIPTNLSSMLWLAFILWMTLLQFLDNPTAAPSSIFGYPHMLLMLSCGASCGLLLGISFRKCCAPSSTEYFTPSYPIYLCLLTLLPINTFYLSFVLLFRDLIFSVAWIGKLMTILSVCVVLLEAMLWNNHIFENKEKIQWPEIEEDTNTSKRGYVDLS